MLQAANAHLDDEVSGPQLVHVHLHNFDHALRRTEYRAPFPNILQGQIGQRIRIEGVFLITLGYRLAPLCAGYQFGQQVIEPEGMLSLGLGLLVGRRHMDAQRNRLVQGCQVMAIALAQGDVFVIGRGHGI